MEEDIAVEIPEDYYIKQEEIELERAKAVIGDSIYNDEPDEVNVDNSKINERGFKLQWKKKI